MDPKFVNLLIQQLLNTTHCPKCGAMLSPLGVKVQKISNNQCAFQMKCKECNAVISADAKMEQQKTDKLKQPQKETLKAKKVSLDDLMQMKKSMQTFPGSFKNLMN